MEVKVMSDLVKNVETVEEVKEVKENKVEEAVEEEIQFTEEELAEREELYDRQMETINDWGLRWTIRSIDYIVENRNVTFTQLRTCVFKIGSTPTYDLSRAVRLILEAGLVGSKQYKSNEMDKCRDRAYELMELWREKHGFIGVLHILLINIMEKKHFFMGVQDVKTLELLSYRNSQKDLVSRLAGMDVLEKAQQVQAVSRG